MSFSQFPTADLVGDDVVIRALRAIYP
jgi:hypothetical protein